MTVDTSTDIPTKLLTLINVSAARPDTPDAKRARLTIPFTKIRQADARAKVAAILKQRQAEQELNEQQAQAQSTPDAAAASSSTATAAATTAASGPDPFHIHFASLGAHGKAAAALASQASSSSSSSSSKGAQPTSKLTRQVYDGLGEILQHETVQSLPPSQEHVQETVKAAYHTFLQQRHRRAAPTALQRSTLAVLQSYADLLHPHVSLAQHDEIRTATAAHVLSHVQKTRRVILRNNERLAKAAARGNGRASAGPNKDGGAGADAMDLDEGEVDGAAQGASPSAVELDDLVRDQGFTRPKVLILLPLRNSALAWVDALSAVSGCVEGLTGGGSKAELTQSAQRFLRDFSLPEGTLDRLAQPDAAARFPADHIATFRGNIDDSFALGFKINRKEWRAYARYYDADIILASPLGLRLAIEKDDDSDFLSSIEIVVADQLDVMQMQNWEHVKFVFSHLNHIPRKVHESTDFARVRQWSLDGASAFLRQTVLLASADTPELRALFAPLKNIAGRRRVLEPPASAAPAGGKGKKGVVAAAVGASGKGEMGKVREGVRQVFVKFDCANAQAEADIRLAHFTAKTLPSLLKSAIASSRTLIFVPSYFDFVLLVDHLEKLEEKGELKFASISEYSNNREIARAREAFFSGKKDFLVLTERFHFYRRYVLRGARTLVFYAPPLHASYYAELAQMPFAVGQGKQKQKQQGGDGDEEEMEMLDASDVSIQTVFCQYDYLRLQGIVGRKRAMQMCGVAAGAAADEEEYNDEGGGSGGERRFGEARGGAVGEEEEERDGPSKRVWRFV
ncbi:rRNA-binding ribosome biosynthesis protein utp25 [Tilletia horrida]|uniref:U3 small nucleolar RNA-associated protein 25 n=1 Tax=Tilletia horrida TaxID=155126 RepID=A0AAN6GHV9_9BASI|nr:rRNA-binding ribosome biosynthesis protein utp25 [Tilletia horrida]